MPKYYEKLTMNEAQEPVFEVYLDGKLDRTETPEQRGLFREKQFVILFQRVALNPMTMRNVSAWFTQKILYKVPNKDGFDFHFFYWEKGMLPHIKIIDSRMGRLAGLCFSVIPSDSTYVRKSAQPKRITKEQRFSILKSGEFEGIPCLGVFNEQGEEYVQPKSD